MASVGGQVSLANWLGLPHYHNAGSGKLARVGKIFYLLSDFILYPEPSQRVADPHEIRIELRDTHLMLFNKAGTHAGLPYKGFTMARLKKLVSQLRSSIVMAKAIRYNYKGFIVRLNLDFYQHCDRNGYLRGCVDQISVITTREIAIVPRGSGLEFSLADYYALDSIAALISRTFRNTSFHSFGTCSYQGKRYNSFDRLAEAVLSKPKLD